MPDSIMYFAQQSRLTTRAAYKGKTKKSIKRNKQARLSSLLIHTLHLPPGVQPQVHSEVTPLAYCGKNPRRSVSAAFATI